MIRTIAAAGVMAALVASCTVVSGSYILRAAQFPNCAEADFWTLAPFTMGIALSMVATAFCSLHPRRLPTRLHLWKFNPHIPPSILGNICLVDVLGGWPKQEAAIRVRSQDRTKYDAQSQAISGRF